MSPEQFAYWLQGYTEITNGQRPDATQWQIMRDHLALALGSPGRPSGLVPTTTTIDMSWYPESLREHNRLHPDNPLFC